MYKAGNRRGVTLIELLIVVAIIGAIAAVSFPALTAGLAGVRLRSASGEVASFLTATMNRVDRREQPVAIVITPKENKLEAFSTLTMPAGVSIEGEEPVRFALYPGGAFPRIKVVLKSEKGARKSIEVDPVTAIPKIESLSATNP